MKHKKYSRKLRHRLSYPFIFVIIFPLIILDIFLELYHRVCFPLYSIPYIKRCHYIRIDRHKLRYLSIGNKIGCVYCGYANGWLHYASIIADETEKYWCGIKHKLDDNFKEPLHHKDFSKYGDEKSYKEKYL